MLAFTPPPRSRPFSLKAWPFEFPTALAPMEGITHPAFRDVIAAAGGVGLLCTEFVRITSGPLNAELVRREVVPSSGVPLSVQVMGNSPERMAEAAQIVARCQADVVDVNLGCPMPKIVRKGVGAALLKDPQLLYDVLCRMRDKTPGLLSAKIRAGFDEAADVVTIAQTVQAAGVDFIAVHPRRRADMYRGTADWRIIAVLKRELRIPVVGNGDVWYADDALRMQEETGCDAVMIGRPAVRNPWIFQQVEALRAGRPVFVPTGAELVEYLAEVAEVYARRFGHLKKQGPMGKLKELAKFLARALDDDGRFVREALRCEGPEQLLDAARRHLEPLTARQIDLGPAGPLRLERSGGTTSVSGRVSPADSSPQLLGEPVV